jgi:hypothetical protein
LGVGGGFAGASIGFLWPTLRDVFGAQLTLPDGEEEILAHIRENAEPYVYPRDASISSSTTRRSTPTASTRRSRWAARRG